MAVADMVQRSWVESPDGATERSGPQPAATEPLTMLVLAHQLYEEHVAEGRAQAEALVVEARRTASAIREQMLEEAGRQRDALVEQGHHAAAGITAEARAELGRLQVSRDVVERELSTLRDGVAQVTRELERLQGQLADTRAAARQQAQVLLDWAKD